MVALLLLHALPILHAEVTTFSPQQLFEQANLRYDQGDFAGALKLYQELISSGHANVETLFNAGNAAYRKGSPGDAVLYFRRAWLLNPRDPDVSANLELVQERTGALKPTTAVIDMVGREFSRREWTLLMKSGYWSAFLFTAIALISPGLRRFAKPTALIAGVIALSGFAGWLYWKHWEGLSEVVVVESRQTVKYEPREKATPFFAVPEGSILFMEDEFHSWVKVRSGQNAGWLPKNAVAPVYPWKSGIER